VSTGASSDFKHATRLANAMVAQMGMSDKVLLTFIQLRVLCLTSPPLLQIGPIYRDEKDLEKASTETKRKIETEVENLLQVHLF